MTDRFNNKQLHNLQPWRAGEVIRERKLNQSVDALNELRRGIRPPRQLKGVGHLGIETDETHAVWNLLVPYWSPGAQVLLCLRVYNTNGDGRSWYIRIPDTLPGATGGTNTHVQGVYMSPGLTVSNYNLFSWGQSDLGRQRILGEVVSWSYLYRSMPLHVWVEGQETPDRTLYYLFPV